MSHRLTGTECQDAHGWRVLSDGTLVAAVADGAGFSLEGGLGARVSVKEALAFLEALRASEPWPQTDDGWGSLLGRALEAAITGIEREAAAHSLEPRDLSTTLILAVAAEDLLAATQVGDGGIVVGSAGREISSWLSPPKGCYANETTFITSPDALTVCQRAVWRNAPRYLAIISDGLQRLAYKLPSREPSVGFFKPIFAFAERAVDASLAQKELEEFLESKGIGERTEDDLTLLAAARID